MDAGLNFGHLKFLWKYVILFHTSPSPHPLPLAREVGGGGGGGGKAWGPDFGHLKF